MSPTTRPSADLPSEQTPGTPSSGSDARRLPASGAAGLGPSAPLTEAERVANRGMESAMWGVVGHLAASLLFYGGLGYLIGRWTGHPILLLFGVLFGLVLSIAYTIYTGTRNTAPGAAPRPGAAEGSPGPGRR